MKTNNRKKILSLLLVVAVISFSYAQERSEQRTERGQRPTPPSYEELLQEMDTNEDGKLAKEETKGPLSIDFKHIDTNKDGFITKEELENGNPKRRKRENRSNSSINITSIFKEMDSNKDKKIAKDEAKNVIAKRFEEFDLNHDNAISKIEMGKAVRKMNNDN